jgi:peptidoglycan/xylan/chitin deacetylase (PgdA/CDA1 family)
MATPYPDYRHYTARDYGLRVGIYRLLDVLAAAGASASVAANAALADHAPPLLADIVSAGHEVIAHSTDMNGTIATGLPEEDERALIGASLDRLQAATGTRPQGWLSIARSQSWNTHRLLREAGVRYCCDWVNDELPWRFANGLINLPLNHELSDRQVIAVQQNSAESYTQQLLDAFDWLGREAEESGGGRMLPIHVTPYIMGLPYRIGAFEQLLSALKARGAWFARPGEIIDAWQAST